MVEIVRQQREKSGKSYPTQNKQSVI